MARFIYDRETKRMVPISDDYAQNRPHSLQILPDMAPFKSPIDGSTIGGRAQRREHMKAHGVVDYERVPTGTASDRKTI